jgi:hypothetical protein
LYFWGRLTKQDLTPADTGPQTKYHCTMKPESKFWKKIKKNTPNIMWTRLESWASFGVPDLLGYNDNCGFFMVEMKIVRGNKVSFSPHQILFHTVRTKRNFILLEEASSSSVKLYESSAIHGLLSDYREDAIRRMRRLVAHRTSVDQRSAERVAGSKLCGLTLYFPN